MTAQQNTERRRFEMHPNLLYDVITKQAGTLQKAILEGVMNGVDAGATRIDVTLDDKTLTIVDDGKGFVDRHEIENFFETFGTPHQEGDATYGRFRMGRGQLLSYGRNTWRTNNFRMEVDIKSNGLDYNLQTLDETSPGCTIVVDLYKPLLPSEKDEVEREIRQWVAFVSIPVVINGKTVSEDPANAKWSIQTDDAYFKLASTRTTLSVYNLGVLVMHAPAHRYGVGGTVVSKQRLDVNFARNDVQNDCPVFRRIRNELRKHADKETKGRRKLSDTERQHLAHRIVACDIDWAEGSTAPILTDIEGKHFSLEAFRNKLWQSLEVLSAAKGDRTAIKVVQQGMANALAEETLHRFDVTDVASLVVILTRYCAGKMVPGEPHQWYAKTIHDVMGRIIPKTVEDYRHLVDDTFETLDPKKLTANQKMLLRAVEKGGYVVASQLDKTYRKILPGRSEVAQAWTDGVKGIWMETSSLMLLSSGYSGATRMAALLLHEYMHDGPDTETHEHDAEFFERFHDVALDTDTIGKAAAAMIRSMAEQARRKGNKLNANVSLFEDMEAKIKIAGGEGSPVTEVPEDLDETAPVRQAA